ncbi:hypothetical protein, partial [Vibrio cholerae]|uniref:hypothetical protein n=1 Tax=Vibrio cholerae TaxID=666 RepID=UPI001C118DBC
YKSTTELHHFYIILTSDLTSELFVHPPPLPARAENGFSGCAGKMPHGVSDRKQVKQTTNYQKISQKHVSSVFTSCMSM